MKTETDLKIHSEIGNIKSHREGKIPRVIIVQVEGLKNTKTTYLFT